MMNKHLLLKRRLIKHQGTFFTGIFVAVLATTSYTIFIKSTTADDNGKLFPSLTKWLSNLNTYKNANNNRLETSEIVKNLLSQNQHSIYPWRRNGIWRYDTNQLASNNPIEDVRVEQMLKKSDDSDWYFFGVLDGHGGRFTAEKLGQWLIPFVARYINKVYDSVHDQRVLYKKPLNSELLDTAIKNAYKDLDQEIVYTNTDKLLKEKNFIPSKTAFTNAADILLPALSGSCALLVFYDSLHCTLKLALTGDSRAVLGYRDINNGLWKTEALTDDQTADSKSELTRLQIEHPNEIVVKNGRILGSLQPTRAFGDAKYKLSREKLQEIFKRYYNNQMPIKLNVDTKTPPYVTAEPIVTTKLINTSQESFLIIASDGLWELLSNEQAVDLTTQWLQKHHPERMVFGANVSRTRKLYNKLFSPATKHSLSVDISDSNASTMLIRNALGGSNMERVASLLTLKYPFSRRCRDDLTVTVIFFGPDKVPNTIKTEKLWETVPMPAALREAHAVNQIEKSEK